MPNLSREIPEAEHSVTISLTEAAHILRLSTEARLFAHKSGLPEAVQPKLVSRVEELVRVLSRHTSGQLNVHMSVRNGEATLTWAAADLRITSEQSRAMSVHGIPASLRQTNLNLKSTIPPGTPRMLVDTPSGAITPTVSSRVAGRGWRFLPDPVPQLTLLERPHPRETLSGDMALVERTELGLRVAVVDGLGHGPAAREAAQRAVESLRETKTLDIQEAVLQAHLLVAQTRGATLGLADVDLRARRIRGTTVGNVRVMLCFGGGRVWSPCGTDAVLGHGRGSFHGKLDVRVEDHPFPPDGLLLLFSDGLTNQLRLPWSANQSDQEELATQLFGAYSLPTDDATLLMIG